MIHINGSLVTKISLGTINTRHITMKPSCYCLISEPMIYNQVLYQNKNNQKFKTWSIGNITSQFFYQIIQQIIKWLLVYFQHLLSYAISNLTKAIYYSLSISIVLLSSVTSTVLDLTLDFIDENINTIPVLSKINPISFETCIKLALASIYYLSIAIFIGYRLLSNQISVVKHLFCKWTYLIISNLLKNFKNKKETKLSR